MPRTSLIATLLLLFTTTAVAAPAKLAPCGTRIQAFNEYEEMDKDKKIVEKVSLFEPSDWSPNAGFEGLLVKSSEDPKTKLEIEVRPSKKKIAKAEWSVGTWGERKDFLAAQNFNRGKAVFGEDYKLSGTYVTRLKVAGKILCEDKPRPMISGH